MLPHPFSDSLATLAENLRANKLPIMEYLTRLEAHFEQYEPDIRAFVPENGRFSRLYQSAQQLQAQYPDPQNRPPLFGIPIGVKDIFHVDGWPTQAGSQLPTDILTSTEATAVTQLKRAGALILGKTVTTEFAYFAPGPTRNPHNLGHTPGGSSSGSSAAVAVGLVPFAFGTQTIGSIIRPASFCGVFGYKPSYERISRAGVIPLSVSLDHIGYFTAHAEDLAFMAQFVCSSWQPIKMNDRPVLGIPIGPYLDHVSPEGRTHFEKTRKKLQKLGYTVREVPIMPDFAQIVAHHNELMAGDCARTHKEWFVQYADLYHSRTAALIHKGKQVSDTRLEELREEQKALRQHLQEKMSTHEVDLWLAPSAPGTAPAGLDSTGDPIMNLPWTNCGFPVVNIPTGTGANGLPLGLQLVGDWYQDEKLLAWTVAISQELERGTGGERERGKG